MMTVSEISRLTGVTVRALHHYDRIGLLKPVCVTDAGYRLYDETSLERLGQILLFRELDFSLTDIARILDNPAYNRTEALTKQIELLRLRRDRCDRLIAMAQSLKEQGGISMDFSAFDTHDIDALEREAKAKWGATDAWQSYAARKDSDTDKKNAADGLMAIFARLGERRGLDPASDEVQSIVAELQAFITDHYYPCTKEILSGLGQMYVADARMKANIDKVGGEGCAELASRAIALFCR